MRENEPREFRKIPILFDIGETDVIVLLAETE